MRAASAAVSSIGYGRRPRLAAFDRYRVPPVWNCRSAVSAVSSSAMPALVVAASQPLSGPHLITHRHSNRMPVDYTERNTEALNVKQRL